MALKRTLLKTDRFRVMYCPGWRNKPAPWWFRGRYQSGGCIQTMGLEVWW